MLLNHYVLAHKELGVLGMDSRELAKKHLCKGIKKPRFRKLKTWKIVNPTLYGLLIANDIKPSELASMIGRAPRTVDAYLYGNQLPKEEIRRKICEIFDYPEYLLFNEEMIKKRYDSLYK